MERNHTVFCGWRYSKALNVDMNCLYLIIFDNRRWEQAKNNEHPYFISGHNSYSITLLYNDQRVCSALIYNSAYLDTFGADIFQDLTEYINYLYALPE